ncbi:hypothetical protein [Asticcacaulis sp. AND118]|uniref:hypothetical protein n=1 Tax=Asticcacaulis sp. AND118 TaxID=2840468 RepID=UPI001CFF6531|nr:hypothetical protein [Asticcacaulis sp. AND118]UDF04762.1 hypothetical protein LH365_06905 [Asticcacaulis sp. AND118]
MSDVDNLTKRMQEAKRDELLMLLAMSISEFTLTGRFHYCNDQELQRLRDVNEAIHRLSGHLRDLCDPEMPLTQSRAEGIREQLGLLPFQSVARILVVRPR